MNRYELYMHKGASSFPVSPDVTAHNASPVNNRGRGYSPAGFTAPCDLSFHGTLNEPASSGGFYSAQLTPQEVFGWLRPAQNFCTFSVFPSASSRRTDGQSANWVSHALPVLFGIQRAIPAS